MNARLRFLLYLLLCVLCGILPLFCASYIRLVLDFSDHKNIYLWFSFIILGVCVIIPFLLYRQLIRLENIGYWTSFIGRIIGIVALLLWVVNIGLMILLYLLSF